MDLVSKVGKEESNLSSYFIQCVSIELIKGHICCLLLRIKCLIRSLCPESLDVTMGTILLKCKVFT